MKRCFFITPIGKEKTKVRERSDQLVDILQEVLKHYDYELIRGDLYGRTGNITSQTIQLLIDAELAIVDLTDQNANVFYELGIRHSTGRSLIPIIQKTEQIPFDVGQERSVQYDLEDEKGIEEFKVAINRIILNTLKFPYEALNPVSRLEDFIPLKSEPFPNEYRLIQIINRLTKSYHLIESFNNSQKHALGIHSINVIRKLSPLILSSLEHQLNRLLKGEIETWGDLNNEIFGLMMESVNSYFRAVSVNDLEYWIKIEGEQYLRYLINKVRTMNIKAERIFILNDFKDLQKIPDGRKKNYFELVLRDQIRQGIAIRIAYTENVKLVSSIVKELDFGLFDEFAVSFFRVAEGRMHRVNFTKETFRRHVELFDKVKLKCEKNPKIEKGDNKIFFEERDLIDWFKDKSKA